MNCCQPNLDEVMVEAKNPCRAIAEYYLKWFEWWKGQQSD